jgi:sulfur-carrier protein adenylyltransferase/sulfurtransferase
MIQSYRDLVAEAKRQIREIEPEDVQSRLQQLLVIDVREPDEFEQGAIPGAILIPRGTLESSVHSHLGSPEVAVAVYCEGGARSALAAKTLQDMGYTSVWSLQGGFTRWKREGLPWGEPHSLSSDQRSRYSRHILLPEVGEEGQVRLLDSKVLLIGAGGLGSPAAIYLAAAGVGTIGIVDYDVVDASNLQRQILHNIDRLGHPKVESARETLNALNPDVKVETHDVRLSADNALEILAGYDIIVDGGDNFPTRYLVNDVSLHLRKPVVHGSIFRFEGQVSVFVPYEGPCYRCQYREPPPPELAPSCAEAGVLGVLPGIVGSIQAVEVIKLILGIGDPLVGRLLTYDALTQEFMDLTIRRDPECPACRDESRPPRIVEYDASCAYPGAVERS